MAFLKNTHKNIPNMVHFVLRTFSHLILFPSEIIKKDCEYCYMYSASKLRQLNIHFCIKTSLEIIVYPILHLPYMQLTRLASKCCPFRTGATRLKFLEVNSHSKLFYEFNQTPHNVLKPYPALH